MGKKILVIEDSEQDQKIVMRFLNKAGYENVSMSGTGEDGVKKAQDEKPDLVITDTKLPGIDGFEVCRRIRKTEGPDTPKIIMMTGAIDAVDAVEARRAGADDYCAKTSDYVPLIEIVKRLV